MISVIVCHRNETFLHSLVENISRTIGIEYELITVDNTQNQHSIFSAYNEGVQRSQYEICCFAHEDILFYTQDWGKNVLRHFEDTSTGMIGVLGTQVLPITPCAWWYNFHFGHCAVNLYEDKSITEVKELRPTKNTLHYYLNPQNDDIRTEVVMADGLWFCIRHSLFTKIRFDEETFSGFHLYDADISLQVRQHAKVFVVYDIVLQHFSRGPTKADYYASLLSFVRKWQAQLPQTVHSIKETEVRKIGWYALRRYLLDLTEVGVSVKERQRIKQEFLPLLSRTGSSLWQRLYFGLMPLFGQWFVNAVFYRIEHLIALPDHRRMKAQPCTLANKVVKENNC